MPGGIWQTRYVLFMEPYIKVVFPGCDISVGSVLRIPIGRVFAVGMSLPVASCANPDELKMIPPMSTMHRFPIVLYRKYSYTLEIPDAGVISTFRLLDFNPSILEYCD